MCRTGKRANCAAPRAPPPAQVFAVLTQDQQAGATAVGARWSRILALPALKRYTEVRMGLRFQFPIVLYRDAAVVGLCLLDPSSPS